MDASSQLLLVNIAEILRISLQHRRDVRHKYRPFRFVRAAAQRSRTVPLGPGGMAPADSLLASAAGPAAGCPSRSARPDRPHRRDTRRSCSSEGCCCRACEPSSAASTGSPRVPPLITCACRGSCRPPWWSASFSRPTAARPFQSADGDHRALGSKRLHDRRRPCARPQSSAVLPLPDQATLRGGLCSLPSRSSPPNVDQSKDKGPPAPRMRGTAVGQRARTVVDITDPARAPDVTLARIPKRGFALTRKITGSNPVSPTSITPSRGRVFGSRCSFTAR